MKPDASLGANPSSAGRSPMTGPQQSGGLGDGLEARPRKPVPEPKGKGLVMIILAVSVIAALAWEFSGYGPASKAQKRAVERAQQQEALENTPEGKTAPPVARANPDEVETPKPAPRRPDPAPRRRDPAPGMIDVQIGATTATLPPALAVAAWLESPADKREAMRLQILEALLPLAKQGGTGAHEAFETAAWLIDGAGEDTTEVVLHLTNATTVALEDDRAALGAILFLSRVPDGVDRRTALSLDSVIVDPTRPLTIRLAAARIRPAEGRSKRVRELSADAATHPALRDALK